MASIGLIDTQRVPRALLVRKGDLNVIIPKRHTQSKTGWRHFTSKGFKKNEYRKEIWEEKPKVYNML